MFNTFNVGRICTEIVDCLVDDGDIIDDDSTQFFIIYMPSQQPKGHIQTQHSLDTGNYIIYKPKLQASTGGRK
jgi:hypothetical protein